MAAIPYLFSEEAELDAKAKEEEDEEQGRESLGNSIRILRFLQLLCEGHHLGIQNYLREQSQGGVVSGKSFNFVTYLATLLGEYRKTFLNGDTLAFGN